MIPVAPLDAAMLLAETVEMPLHNIGVMLFAPPIGVVGSPSVAMYATLASHVHRVPALHRKLVEAPFGLGDMHWVDDSVFDLGRHVVHIRLPSPGSDAELAALVGDYAARLLPRDRPLWEIALVEGLAGGQLAVLAKIHHATMDGARLAALLRELLDETPNDVHVPSRARTFPRASEPGAVRLAFAELRTLAQKPRRVIRAARDVAGALARSRGESSRELEPRTSTLDRIPPTPWGGALSVRRSAAFGSVSLDDVRAIGAAFDATINDVVLAASAGALRRWLIERDALPSRALVANVPVAVGDSGDDAGNHVSMLRVHLPMDALEPATRLARIREETSHAKRSHRTRHANTFLRLADLVLGITVPRVLAAAVSFYARHRGADLHPAFWNVVVSNVPGPRVPLYCGGARLACIYPLGPVQHGSGLNLTVMSAGDRLGLGVLACAERVPHVDGIATAFVDEVARLLDAARRRSAPSG